MAFASCEIINSVRIDMNASMRRIYDQIPRQPGPIDLPPELNAVAEGGLIVIAGRLYLAAPEHSSQPYADFDDWEAERWVNKVHLDTATPADEPEWRGELLTNGLELARRLLVAANPLITLPVQAVVSLQSAEGESDPDIDYATGALHIYQIRTQRDDLVRVLDRYSQPTLILTSSSD